ncbi:MAG: hypothetical protein FWB86_07600 [Treponema sp.]|nr:hypothetical protein [Treponema sp.]MCL2251890.1 hypothetical protein [Treponema sp.]
MIKKYLIVLIFFLISVLLFSFGSKEKEVPTIQVTGIVRLTGSALFPELVITGTEKEWYIAKEEMNKLHNLQHRRVTVEAAETIKELTFANGMPAGIRRELRNITIISVE